MENLTPNLTAFFCAMFIAILFLQSGLDKLLDWDGNLKFLMEHFASTPFHLRGPLMLAVITFLELATAVQRLSD